MDARTGKADRHLARDHVDLAREGFAGGKGGEGDEEGDDAAAEAHFRD